MFSYLLTPWTLFTDFSFHTMLIHALRAFFYPAVWLTNLKVSRWSWNCAPDPVREVGAELTWLRTGSFSTSSGSFQIIEHTSYRPRTHRGTSFGPQAGREARQHLCSMRWPSSRTHDWQSRVRRLGSLNRQDVSKHNPPLKRSVLFRLHGGVTGSRSIWLQLTHQPGQVRPTQKSGWGFHASCTPSGKSLFLQIAH